MTRAGKWLWGFALLYSLAHFGYSVAAYNPMTHPVSADDLRVTFLEAQHWRQTGNLTLLGGTNVFYGLLYYGFLSLFSAFSFEQLVFPFYLSQVVLFPLALFFLMQAVAGKRITRKEIGLVTILTLNFGPFLESFASCKVECMEFYLICLVFYGLLKGRDWLAGAGVVSGMFMKYLPGFLGIYFLLKRKWKAVGWCLAWGLLVSGTLWAIFGGRTFREIGADHFLALVFSRKVETNEMVALLEWQTLSSTLNRLFAHIKSPNDWDRVLKIAGTAPVDHARLVTLLALVFKFFFIGIYLSVIGRRWTALNLKTQRLLLALEMSLTLLMTVILVQAVRIHHAIILFPAFLTTALLLFQYRDLFQRSERGLFLAAYALSAVLIPGGLLNRLPPSPIWGQSHARMYYWLSLPFYGYVLLFFCVALCHRKLSSRHNLIPEDSR